MDIQLFSLLGFGFLLGTRHAFEADHIAAVSAIVSQNKSIKKSLLVGAFWGFGHTIALFLVGLAVLLMKINVPEKLTLSFEFIIGIMLVLLGINVLATFNKNRIHLHRHRHGKEEHIHFHSHKSTKQHSHEHFSMHKSFLIGILHGLAGSAAITLLILTSINSLWLGLFYIILFGIGLITGMALISSVISLPFSLIPSKLAVTQKILRISAGLISTIMGFAIIKNILI